MTTAEPYEFVGGYPTTETVERAYDEADLNRAVSAYRFFYPGNYPISNALESDEDRLPFLSA